MTNRRPRVVLIGPRVSDFIFREIVAGAAARAQADDVSLVVYSAPRWLGGMLQRSVSYGEADMALRICDPATIDAAVLHVSGCVPPRSLDEITAFAARMRVPLVLIGGQIDGYTSLVPDNAAAIEGLVEHLIAVHGAQRIAYVDGPAANPEAQQRHEGVLRCLAAHGRTLQESERYVGDFSGYSGHAAVRAFYDERRITPDAIVCANDAMAAGVIEELTARGIRVPQDVAVTGFDDSLFAEVSTPRLTTARQAFAAVGATSIQTAIGLSGRDGPGTHIVSTVAIYRGSCGCNAVTAPQNPDPELEALPEFKALVAVLRDVMSTGVRSGTDGALLQILDTVPDQGDRLIRLAFRAARAEPASARDPTAEERTERLVTLVCSQYTARTQRVGRLREENLTTNELLLSRKVDQITTPRQFAVDARAELKFVGVREYEFLRIMSPSEAILIGSDPSRDGEKLPLDLTPRMVSRVADSARPDTVTVVAPLPFAPDILGYGTLNITLENVRAADTVFSALGAMLNRLRLMDELDRAEEMRRESYERLVATQGQLVESERLASLGRLIAGVAHELNTPLGIATTALSYASKRLEEAEDRDHATAQLHDISEAMGMVDRSLARMRDIVARFMSVSPSGPMGNQPNLDLGEVVRTIVAGMRLELAMDRVEVALEIPEAVQTALPVDVVSRILFALVSNSVQHGFADGRSGVISLWFRTNGREMKLVYADNGHGVDDEEISHLFEPFYTTRRAQGHIGLGLHAIRNLITGALGGTIVASRNHPSGLTYAITLPNSITPGRGEKS